MWTLLMTDVQWMPNGKVVGWLCFWGAAGGVALREHYSRISEGLPTNPSRWEPASSSKTGCCLD